MNGVMGDYFPKNNETIEIIEECLVNYLENLVQKAHKRGLRRDPNTNKIHKEDLLYFLKSDPKKYMRVAYYLISDKRIGEEKKAVKDDVMNENFINEEKDQDGLVVRAVLFNGWQRVRQIETKKVRDATMQSTLITKFQRRNLASLSWVIVFVHTVFIQCLRMNVTLV
eukprot:TRINITY_DN8495_c0_g1_i1.p2 TRINITY_DN8495_c0_g1~~TRINITY_DN8495_c0_g1_i1.p2  ORF type:complete len:168 (-),score=15.51 TRINITY_DN8495_c0_g1_i1:164-667(-)